MQLIHCTIGWYRALCASLQKMVCMSSSLSLLLDSLLCAMAPLTGLTMHIPELRSCTQHTLVSIAANLWCIHIISFTCCYVYMLSPWWNYCSELPVYCLLKGKTPADLCFTLLTQCRCYEWNLWYWQSPITVAVLILSVFIVQHWFICCSTNQSCCQNVLFVL